MPERTPYIAANWKMHKTVAEAAAFVDALLPRIAATQNDVVICPPFTALTAVVERRYGTAVKVAAQNMHEEDSGAFTGEVSAPMLAELDVQAVGPRYARRRGVRAPLGRRGRPRHGGRAGAPAGHRGWPGGGRGLRPGGFPRLGGGGWLPELPVPPRGLVTLGGWVRAPAGSGNAISLAET